ncbi:peptidyl-prolyl cis-trans isomerase FKBP8-like [Pelodiscus sinensis]|uniref:peptidyl-prolyl cis-trans isomerase FKBP8-like n=1 Tax=Pelodiscus sinensis TaxID=13735 RepID=UPI003F6C546D
MLIAWPGHRGITGRLGSRLLAPPRALSPGGAGLRTGMVGAGQSPQPQGPREVSPGAQGEAETPREGRELEGSPGLRRAVRFLLPPTTIEAPLAQEEERQFYQGLAQVLGPKQGGFQELFTAAGWADVTEDRLLRKWQVREGRGEASRPQLGQEVTVKLLGVLEDSSLVEKDPKLTFHLGQGDVIQALELGVQAMQLGEVSFLLSSFLYAYGHLGRDPDIPSGASLLYEVTLLQIRDGPCLGLLPAPVRISLSNQKRERGNFHFEREEYQRALGSYRLALGLLDPPGAAALTPCSRAPFSPPRPEEEEELREQQVKCLNNCAAAQLKLQLFEEALASCEAALHRDPDSVKALYRKGKLLSERGEDQEAMSTLKRALQLEPSAKAIHAELSKLAKRQKGQLERPAPTAAAKLQGPLGQPAAGQSTWVHRFGPPGHWGCLPVTAQGPALPCLPPGALPCPARACRPGPCPARALPCPARARGPGPCPRPRPYGPQRPTAA